MDSMLPKYLRPYQLAEQLHGPDFKATLWNSRASQRIRFEVISEICRLAGRRVLDAGCGMGDLLAFLEEIGQPPARYIGIEALPSILGEASRRRFATPAEFHLGDLVVQPGLLRTGSPEVIVISGTLNTLEEDEFFAVLDRAFDSAGVGLVFNFLSTHHGGAFAEQRNGPIRRMDPARVFAHGLTRTCQIVVRHDYYQGHDCTMAWMKE